VGSAACGEPPPRPSPILLLSLSPPSVAARGADGRGAQVCAWRRDAARGETGAWQRAFAQVEQQRRAALGAPAETAAAFDAAGVGASAGAGAAGLVSLFEVGWVFEAYLSARPFAADGPPPLVLSGHTVSFTPY